MTPEEKEVLELLAQHGGTYFEHVTAGPGLCMAKGSVYFESLDQVSAFLAEHAAKVLEEARDRLHNDISLLTNGDYENELTRIAVEYRKSAEHENGKEGVK